MPRPTLPQLLRQVRDCNICANDLPLGPRPIVQWKKKPSLVIIGQAPGTKVHESGIPWDDDSGDHLRAWLKVDRDTFYDGALIALMPMGFCYPGKQGSGDAPPAPRCAPQWHEKLMAHANEDALVLLVGQYAQSHYLGVDKKKTLTETVRSYAEYLPKYIPLPHPSWRSKIWMKKNPWFEKRVLPALRKEVRARTHE